MRSVVRACMKLTVAATFGMVAALLIRRAQLVASGEQDPYPIVMMNESSLPMDVIDAESEKMAILRLVYVLERGISLDVEHLTLNVQV